MAARCDTGKHCVVAWHEPWTVGTLSHRDELIILEPSVLVMVAWVSSVSVCGVDSIENSIMSVKMGSRVSIEEEARVSENHVHIRLFNVVVRWVMPWNDFKGPGDWESIEEDVWNSLDVEKVCVSSANVVDVSCGKAWNVNVEVTSCVSHPRSRESGVEE